MARIKQFSDDLGISYKKAKNLIMTGRNKNDKGKSALDKYLEGMKKAQKEADRLAAEDANMVLKRSNGGGASSRRDQTSPYSFEEDKKSKKKKVPTPIEMPDEIRKKRYAKKRKQNERAMGQDTVRVSRATGGVTRRGDDQPVIKAKDGKYNSHGSSCGCSMCGESVRGMGRAYQGNPRSVKIR